VSSDSVFQVSDCFCTNTSATINVTSCELYTSPGGKFYDVSGTYLDTISNAAGCDSLLTINLLVTGFPLATASATPSTCNLINGTATASATGGGGTYNYTWSNGATGSLISGLAEGTYTVSVTDQNGCPAQAQVSVGNIPAADVRVIASDTLILLGDTVKISVLNGDNYLWTPSAGLNCTDCASVLAFPSRNTTYFVTGKDAAGCVYSRSVTIVVDIVCNELFVPDIFSPNGMGNPENEKICVYSNCITEMTFAIYNRWGELIFLTNDVNACWDGTHKGVTAMTGVYAYRLFVEQLDGNKIERTGKITLTK
jgi:gliding motility-associated-like protein